MHFQTELIRFVKQLERIRTDLQSTLREIEVNLDQQAQVLMNIYFTGSGVQGDEG